MLRLACSVLLVVASLTMAGCTTPEETSDKKGDQELSTNIEVHPNDSVEGNETGGESPSDTTEPHSAP